MRKIITALIAAIALVFGGAVAPASAALPAAKSTAVVRTAFPAYITDGSPTKAEAVGKLYHRTSSQVLVSTRKCASGTALQGTFYNWTTIAGGLTPLYTKPIYVIVCR